VYRVTKKAQVHVVALRRVHADAREQAGEGGGEGVDIPKVDEEEDGQVSAQHLLDEQHHRAEGHLEGEAGVVGGREGGMEGWRGGGVEGVAACLFFWQQAHA
jgi:hypothetical protein